MTKEDSERKKNYSNAPPIIDVKVTKPLLDTVEARTGYPLTGVEKRNLDLYSKREKKKLEVYQMNQKRKYGDPDKKLKTRKKMTTEDMLLRGLIK